MVQHINLLNPALLPKPGPLSPQRLLGVCAVAVLAVLALSVALDQAGRSAKAAHAAAAARHQAEREGLRLQLAALPAVRKPEALAEEVKWLAGEVEGQRQLLERVQAGQLAPQQRHSALLRLLATATPSGVWLTGLQAGAGKVTLEGQALQAPALRDWVAGLNQGPYFEGRPLEQLQAQREVPAADTGISPARLKFQIGTGAPAPARSRS